MFVVGKPKAVTNLGSARYDSFTCAASDGKRVLGMWRSAKAYGHAADVNAYTKAAFTTDGYNYTDPISLDLYPNPLGETSPVGLTWDGSKFLLVALVRNFSDATGTTITSRYASLLSSPDGKVWDSIGTVSIPTVSWFYPSDILYDKGKIVIAGYGGFANQSRDDWWPITSASTDGGKTWSTPKTIDGLPNFPKHNRYAEPKITKSGSTWFMQIRCDQDGDGVSGGDWNIHQATSSDGVTWHYAGITARNVSGMPTVIALPDGSLITLLRKRSALNNTHGEWAWATSTDGGLWWDYREDWPDDGRFMMYGAMALLPNGSVACLYASENDVTRLWESSSVMSTVISQVAVQDAQTPTPVNTSSTMSVGEPWKPPAWRYFVYRLNGNGTETKLYNDISLGGVEITPTLSGVSTFKADIESEDLSLEKDLVTWSTVIYPERNNQLQGGFIITDITKEDNKLSIDAQSFVSYAKNTPYKKDVVSYTDTDALTIFRAIWSHIQAQPNSSLGLKLDASGTSGVYMGRQSYETWQKVNEGSKVAQVFPEGKNFQYIWIKTPAKPAVTKKSTKLVNGKRVTTTTTTPAKAAVTETLYCTATRTFKPVNGKDCTLLVNKTTRVVSRSTGTTLPAGYEVLGWASAAKPKQDSEGDELKAYELNWYTDFDLGEKLDNLAEEGNFDYWEEHKWNGEGVDHLLHFGIPQAGRFREDLRFIVGENIMNDPQLGSKGDDFATEVIVLGSGEGKDMIQGSWNSGSTGLCRTKVITDKSIRTKDEANQRAEREGKAAQVREVTSSLRVRDHANAPFGSWNLGDSFMVYGSNQGWNGDMSLKVRLLSWTIDPSTDQATLNVIPAEKA